MSNQDKSVWVGDLASKDLAELLRKIAGVAEASPDRKINCEGLADILLESANRIDGKVE